MDPRAGDLPPAGAPARKRKREIVHEFFLTPGRLFMLVITVLVVSTFSLFVRFARRDRAFSRGLSEFVATGDLGAFRRARAAAAAPKPRKLREFLREERRLAGTAIMTLATGDAAAKHAVALVQMLRDTHTQVPRIIVLLSRGGIGSEDCHNETLRSSRGRHYSCSSDYVHDDDIISRKYLDALGRLGAEVLIIVRLAARRRRALRSLPLLTAPRVPPSAAPLSASLCRAGPDPKHGVHNHDSGRPRVFLGHVLQQAAYFPHD